MTSIGSVVSAPSLENTTNVVETAGAIDSSIPIPIDNKITDVKPLNPSTAGRRRSRVNSTKDDFIKIQQQIMAASLTSVSPQSAKELAKTHSQSEFGHNYSLISGESSSIGVAGEKVGELSKMGSAAGTEGRRETGFTLEGPASVRKESSMGRVNAANVKLSLSARSKSESERQSAIPCIPTRSASQTYLGGIIVLDDEGLKSFPPFQPPELNLGPNFANLRPNPTGLGRRRSSVRRASFLLSPSISEESSRLSFTPELIKLSNMAWFYERGDVFLKLSKYFTFEKHVRNEVLQHSGQEVNHLFWIIEGTATVTLPVNFVEFTSPSNKSEKRMKVYNSKESLKEGEAIKVIELETQELCENMWFPFLPRSSSTLQSAIDGKTISSTDPSEICKFSVTAHKGSVTARIDVSRFLQMVPPAFIHTMNYNCSVYNFPESFLQVEYLQSMEYEVMAAKARTMENSISLEIDSDYAKKS